MYMVYEDLIEGHLWCLYWAHLSMHGLIGICGRDVSAWLLFQLLGICLASFGATWLYHYNHHNWGVRPGLGVWAVLGGLLSGKAMYILRYGLGWSAVWHLSQSGTMSTGAFLGVFVVLLLYALIRRIAFLSLSDAIAPFAALAEACGHFGCFMAGCCFGTVTELPWGIRFPAGSRPFGAQVAGNLIDESAQRSLPVHPVQLLNVAVSLVVFMVLLRIFLRVHRTGLPTLVFIFSHACLRFFAQFLRADTDRFLLDLSFVQTASLAISIGAAVLYYLWFLRGYPKPGEKISPPKEAEA
jgi:phosphatidylglycerol:prolipoprotein diacylglycerol transferase